MQVWESLSGLMPQLVPLLKSLVSYPTETNENSPGNQLWLFWQFFFLFLSIYFNLNIQIVTRTIWTFSVYTCKIITLTTVTVYPESEVSGHSLQVNLLAQEKWCCWKVRQYNWLILQMVRISLKSHGPSRQPKYGPQQNIVAQEFMNVWCLRSTRQAPTFFSAMLTSQVTLQPKRGEALRPSFN